MSSKNSFTWNTPDSAADVTDRILPTASDPSNSLDRMAKYVDGMAMGVLGYTNAAFKIGIVNATATLTMTGAATALQTLSVANVTFTAETSGATGNQYNLNATPTTQAANIAAAINGSTNLANLVTATSALGVVTISAFTGGVEGNGLQISAGNTSNMTAAAFSGGSNGTKTVLAS